MLPLNIGLSFFKYPEKGAFETTDQQVISLHSLQYYVSVRLLTCRKVRRLDPPT
jgi:hypothetical protein